MTELTLQTPEVFKPLDQPSRYKGAYGGRGSGKSWHFASMVVERCLLKPGSRIVCIREIQKTLAQSAKALIESTIQALGRPRAPSNQRNHARPTRPNALFAVLLAKNGRDHKALWRDLREFHRSIRKLFVASQRITPGT